MAIQYKQHTLLVAATLALAFQINVASADSVTFDLDYEFSGAQEPVGPTPWLRATFADIAGGVQLTMSAINLTASEYVQQWLFNLDSGLNPAALTFTHESGQLATSSAGTNAFKSAGGASFDILFKFPNSGDRFTTGETSVYTITGADIAAASFDFGSFGGSKGSLSSAAHIAAVGANGQGSGWIADGNGGDPTGGISSVPEPGSLALLSLGSLTLFGCSRRRKQAA